MTLDAGTIILGACIAVIPTATIGLVGWLLAKRWDSLDAAIKNVVEELKEHNRHSDAVHADQWRAINTTTAKVAKIEGRLET